MRFATLLLIEWLPLSSSLAPPLCNLLELVKPLYYSVEKLGSATMIPSVKDLTGRQTLANCGSDGETFDHQLWTAVLQRHVVEGRTFGAVDGVNAVDYDALAADVDFAGYLEQLASADPTKLAPPEQLAFWMNAYNALCCSVVVAAEKSGKRLASITDLSQSGNAVWDQPAGVVAGRMRTLNEIEHDELRRQWDEPRLHACIVCASASCPNLPAQAFEGNQVDAQMTDQFRAWLTNPTKGLRAEERQTIVSRIFLWFEDDFGGREGVRDYLQQYMPDSSRVLPTLRYFEYDWQLNRA